MGRYILRRVLTMIPVLFGVSLLIFAIMRIAPGDVATMILSQDGSEGDINPQALEELRETLGLNDPYHVQYWDFVSGLARLDPGTSLWTDKPVLSVLRDRMGVTLELAILAAIFSLLIAIPIGVISAVNQDRWADYLFRIVAIAGVSVPSFWLGTIAIIALTRYFQWAPPLGYVEITDDPSTNL